jgi:hypothetical protein
VEERLECEEMSPEPNLLQVHNEIKRSSAILSKYLERETKNEKSRSPNFN